VTGWEYRSVTIAVGAGDELAGLGVDGWEAYAGIPHSWDGYAAFDVTKITVLLKRPLVSS
jgi:hypothetical protein